MTDRSKAIKQSDDIFSRLIKRRDVHCQWPGCNSTDIHPHHVYGRWYHTTRWSPENAIGLCNEHHDWVQTHPSLTEEFIIHFVGGKEAYYRLREKAHALTRISTEYIRRETIKHLRQVEKEGGF